MEFGRIRQFDGASIYSARPETTLQLDDVTLPEPV
jgi:hypothetical protein